MRPQAIFSLSMVFVCGLALAWTATAAHETATPSGGAAPATSGVSEQACRDLTELVTKKLYQKRALMPYAAFEKLYLRWPKDKQKEYLAANHQQRQKLFRDYYGLVENTQGIPGDPYGLPQGLSLVEKDGKRWVHANCLLCHGGQTFGKSTPGVGNPKIDLQGLFGDIFLAKKSPSGMVFRERPMNHTRGAIDVFSSVAIFLHARDGSGDARLMKQLEIATKLATKKNAFGDVPATFVKPPSWFAQAKYSKYIYADGSFDRNSAMLAQFNLVPELKKSEFAALAKDLDKLTKLIKECRPPASYADTFPAKFDVKSAARGKDSYDNCCRNCHGGEKDGKYQYPDRLIPIETVGTDPVRYNALSKSFKDQLGKLLVGKDYKDVGTEGKGYRAPPLAGIAGRPPYLHNGSVPTLEAIIDPSRRPRYWTILAMNGDEYDHNRLGLRVQEYSRFSDIPATLQSGAGNRTVYDTTRSGHSNSGHDLACIRAIRAGPAGSVTDLLEYLKSL